MKQLIPKITIKRFILLWISTLLFCFLFLALSLIWSTNTLQSMSSRIFMDSKALELSRQLETAILAERREELLWKATQDEQHLEERDRKFSESEVIVKDLNSYTTSQEEILLLSQVKNRLDNLKIVTEEEPSIPIEKISVLADSLLIDIRDYSKINQKQIEETMIASKNLNAFVDRLTLILILSVALIGITGSITLVNKIIRPIVALKHTAERFGKGDLQIRSTLHPDDEFGMLCKTFNDMAENISVLEKYRFNFFASVAHDLKNPLIIVGGAARRIQKKIVDSPEQSKWLNCIIEQIADLENLINDLMDSLQLEIGKLTLNTTDLELSTLLHSLQHIHDETIASHRIVFKKEGECLINGDEKRLRRVISNLISNAVKYSPTGSTISIQVKRIENNAVITVSDEGYGISLNDTTKLFQPFERLDPTRGLVLGTGLGLFSAKAIIEVHGGTINIYNNVEKGSTVEINLPIINHEDKEEVGV
ncbi:MAG: HAMP domain-containing histidine kinase [Methanocellales archaeon]|nr:HAMP domain-containing histidine kinase [Methanocellales archaeon]